MCLSETEDKIWLDYNNISICIFRYIYRKVRKCLRIVDLLSPLEMFIYEFDFEFLEDKKTDW